MKKKIQFERKRERKGMTNASIHVGTMIVKNDCSSGWNLRIRLTSARE